MEHFFEGKTLASLCAVALCTLLVFSFGLHTVQVDHDHPGVHAHAGEGSIAVVGEYMHASDKKLFLFAVLGFLMLGVYIVTARYNWIVLLVAALRFAPERLFSTQKGSLRLHCHLQELFSSGILNTKAY